MTTSTKTKNDCDNCKFHTRGVIHGYDWQECKKNWSDKVNGEFYGVIKHICANHQKNPQSKN